LGSTHLTEIIESDAVLAVYGPAGGLGDPMKKCEPLGFGDLMEQGGSDPVMEWRKHLIRRWD